MEKEEIIDELEQLSDWLHEERERLWEAVEEGDHGSTMKSYIEGQASATGAALEEVRGIIEMAKGN